MAYAVDTSVPVEKSRAELEGILLRYGAARFAYMTDEKQAVIGFVAYGKAVKFVLPLPDRAAYSTKKRYSRKVACTPEETQKLWEQACRSRWRALTLVVKAKLEAAETGITSFEKEFLAHFVMPGGGTFGDYAIPKIEEATRSGKMPTMQLIEG